MEIHYRLSWTYSWIFINLERKHYIKPFSGKPQEFSKMRIKERAKKGVCFEVATNTPGKKDKKPWILRKMLNVAGEVLPSASIVCF